MRSKRGVTAIKRFLFFTASLSIVALGAVWMMLFNEPMADTMTKAPEPKKRALAYEQALATQPENEDEAPKAKSEPKAGGVAKAKSTAESTGSAARPNVGNTSPGQAAPNQQVAALPQGALPNGQGQPSPDGPAPNALPWLNQQGDSVVVPPGQSAGPNGQPRNFFEHLSAAEFL